ncbi:MAG: ribulokinase [Kiritimatiellae bacterium]|nr:ribulokinase [Kiritimatiellia bacterium]
MPAVAGVDFGTQSVRVSIVDSERGRLGSAVAPYEVIRDPADPDFATQRHADHMAALGAAVKEAVASAGIAGAAVRALAIDTTGSTVVPVGGGLEPLGDYYLWCDHRGKVEAAQITRAARAQGLKHIEWCGGVYSSEWGFSKVLHWLRANPQKRAQMASALEHCDMIVAVLSGKTDPRQVTRSVCAAGHKWMYQPSLGGLPPQHFLASVDPLLEGVRDRVCGEYGSSFEIGGRLTPEWAARLGLAGGIPIPVGAFDAHWDAIGAGIREGDIVNVVGTSVCIMGIARQVDLIPGVCGVVKGSIHPDYFGIEAGLSAAGDIFEAIARRAGTSVGTLSAALDGYRPGQTGLLRLTWDNGDRTVLVNPNLGGITLGWTLTSTAADELFAAMEGVAMHTRIIIERMAEYGVPVNRIINAGGIPQKNDTLNQVYANVLGMPILIPEQETTSLGSAIFAMLAAGIFKTVEAAQDALCPAYRVVKPKRGAKAVYGALYRMFKKLYVKMGSPDAGSVTIGKILPALRAIAEKARA